jgi:hypothetical protein
MPIEVVGPARVLLTRGAELTTEEGSGRAEDVWAELIATEGCVLICAAVLDGTLLEGTAETTLTMEEVEEGVAVVEMLLLLVALSISDDSKAVDETSVVFILVAEEGLEEGAAASTIDCSASRQQSL